MGNGCSVYDANGCSIGFVEFVACKLDFGGVNGDEGVASCFLKIVWMRVQVHLWLRVLLALLSVLRRSCAGRNVVLRSLPRLVLDSAIGFITS